MLRPLLFAVCSLVLTALCAQWNGGPLTITVSPAFGTHHPVETGDRGGPPPNDQCANAVVTPLPQNGSVSVTGTNIGATDTEDFGNPNVWEAFSIDTCSTVTVSYCGTAPVHTLVYSILIVGCPGDASIQNAGTTFCGDGNTTINYENLPAGIYYVPVLLFPGEAEGPYTITFTTDVCDLPPVNERCIDATLLTVVQDCADGTVAGNNGSAVQNGGDPTCQPSAAGLQDVWYTFDSGPYGAVVITLDPGTTTDLGVDVFTSCGGQWIFCGSGDLDHQVNSVSPGNSYRVRVFSNNDFGFGGEFTICVHVPPAPLCDGGSVELPGGATSAVVCAGLDPSLELTVNSTAPYDYSLLLATAGDTLLAVLPDDMLVTDTLALGEYHVWGLSHDGALNALIGDPVDSVFSGGICSALSATPVIVSVEVCQGLASGAEPGIAIWSADDGRIRIRSDLDLGWAGCSMFDAQGRRVWHERRPLPTAAVAEVDASGHAAGAYLFQVMLADGRTFQRPVILR